MPKIAGLKKYAAWLLPLVLFLFSFGLRSIKANYFSLWSDGFITSHWDRLDRLLEFHHFDNNAPLPPVVNLLFKEIFGNNHFAQRFPHILVVSLAVLVFYQMILYFLKDRRWAFALALVPATGLMFVYYAQEIRPYSYLLFFTLLSFYYGYRVIVDGDERWKSVLLLLLAFTVLPLTQYMSWFHFLALDVSLTIIVLLFASRKLSSLLKLVAINVFILLAYIPWADSIYQYVVENLAMRANPLAKYRFTGRVFWEAIDKFAGAGGLWSQFLFVVFLASALCLFWHLGKKLFKKEKPDSFDKFALVTVFYWPIFFLLVSRARYTEDIFFWRHYMFLVWPFYILIFYGLFRFWQWRAPLLGRAPKIVPILIVGFFLVSNLADTAAYLLAPDRFFNWPAVVNFIEPMILSGQKKKIYTDNPGDLRAYLETEMTPARAANIWSKVDVVTRKKLYEEIAPRSAKDVIFVRISITNEPPQVLTQGFDHLKTFGRSHYLDFLIKRGAAAVSNWYELHTVYY